MNAAISFATYLISGFRHIMICGAVVYALSHLRVVATDSDHHAHKRTISFSSTNGSTIKICIELHARHRSRCKCRRQH